jgi:ribose-phosphate pyrophosphokinase
MNKVFSGSTCNVIAQDIINAVNDKDIRKRYTLGDLSIDKFADGEILPRFNDSVRYQNITIVNSLFGSDSIIETLLAIDAAKRADCNEITLISPYMAYSRQDKNDHRRSSVGAKTISNILTSIGLNKLRRLITIDLHSSSIQGFYDIPVVNLSGNRLFLPYVKKLAQKLDNICIIAPDSGAVKRNMGIANKIPNTTFGQIYKKRDRPNEIAEMRLIGDVEGKNVIMFDDICDTGGTLVKGAELILKHGAKSVRCFCTHGVLSKNAIELIEDSCITEFITSDSLQKPLELLETTRYSKLTVISCAELIADVIYRIEAEMSIEDLNILD